MVWQSQFNTILGGGSGEKRLNSGDQSWVACPCWRKSVLRRSVGLDDGGEGEMNARKGPSCTR